MFWKTRYHLFISSYFTHWIVHKKRFGNETMAFPLVSSLVSARGRRNAGPTKHPSCLVAPKPHFTASSSPPRRGSCSSEPAGSDPLVPPPLKASSSQAEESWKIPVVSARPLLLSEETLGLRVCKLWCSVLRHKVCLCLCERASKLPPLKLLLLSRLLLINLLHISSVWNTSFKSSHLHLRPTQFRGINPRILFVFFVPPFSPESLFHSR